jgi:hypothetical protein
VWRADNYDPCRQPNRVSSVLVKVCIDCVRYHVILDRIVIFWCITPCGLVDTYGSEEHFSSFYTNLPDCTVSFQERQHEYSPPLKLKIFYILVHKLYFDFCVYSVTVHATEPLVPDLVLLTLKLL